MAEALLSTTADPIMSLIEEQARYHVNLVRGAEKEVLKLGQELNTIRNVLNDAEITLLLEYKLPKFKWDLKGCKQFVTNKVMLRKDELIAGRADSDDETADHAAEEASPPKKKAAAKTVKKAQPTGPKEKGIVIEEGKAVEKKVTFKVSISGKGKKPAVSDIAAEMSDIEEDDAPLSRYFDLPLTSSAPSSTTPTSAAPTASIPAPSTSSPTPSQPLSSPPTTPPPPPKEQSHSTSPTDQNLSSPPSLSTSKITILNVTPIALLPLISSSSSTAPIIAPIYTNATIISSVPQNTKAIPSTSEPNTSEAPPPPPTSETPTFIPSVPSSEQTPSFVPLTSSASSSSIPTTSSDQPPIQPPPSSTPTSSIIQTPSTSLQTFLPPAAPISAPSAPVHILSQTELLLQKKAEMFLDVTYPNLKDFPEARAQMIELLFWREIRLCEFEKFNAIVKSSGVAEFQAFEKRMRRFAKVSKVTDLTNTKVTELSAFLIGKPPAAIRRVTVSISESEENNGVAAQKETTASAPGTSSSTPVDTEMKDAEDKIAAKVGTTEQRMAHLERLANICRVLNDEIYQAKLRKVHSQVGAAEELRKKRDNYELRVKDLFSEDEADSDEEAEAVRRYIKKAEEADLMKYIFEETAEATIKKFITSDEFKQILKAVVDPMIEHNRVEFRKFVTDIDEVALEQLTAESSTFVAKAQLLEEKRQADFEQMIVEKKKILEVLVRELKAALAESYRILGKVNEPPSISISLTNLVVAVKSIQEQVTLLADAKNGGNDLLKKQIEIAQKTADSNKAQLDEPTTWMNRRVQAQRAKRFIASTSNQQAALRKRRSEVNEEAEASRAKRRAQPKPRRKKKAPIPPPANPLRFLVATDCLIEKFLENEEQLKVWSEAKYQWIFKYYAFQEYGANPLAVAFPQFMEQFYPALYADILTIAADRNINIITPALGSLPCPRVESGEPNWEEIQELTAKVVNKFLDDGIYITEDTIRNRICDIFDIPLEDRY